MLLYLPDLQCTEQEGYHNMVYQVNLNYKPPHKRTAVEKRVPFGRVIKQNLDGKYAVTYHATRGWRRFIPTILKPPLLGLAP